MVQSRFMSTEFDYSDYGTNLIDYYHPNVNPWDMVLKTLDLTSKSISNEKIISCVTFYEDVRQRCEIEEGTVIEQLYAVVKLDVQRYEYDSNEEVLSDLEEQFSILWMAIQLSNDKYIKNTDALIANKVIYLENYLKLDEVNGFATQNKNENTDVNIAKLISLEIIKNSIKKNTLKSEKILYWLGCFSNKDLLISVVDSFGLNQFLRIFSLVWDNIKLYSLTKEISETYTDVTELLESKKLSLIQQQHFESKVSDTLVSLIHSLKIFLEDLELRRQEAFQELIELEKERRECWQRLSEIHKRTEATKKKALDLVPDFPKGHGKNQAQPFIQSHLQPLIDSKLVCRDDLTKSKLKNLSKAIENLCKDPNISSQDVFPLLIDCRYWEAETISPEFIAHLNKLLGWIRLSKDERVRKHMSNG